MEANFTIHEHELPTVANADPKKVEEFRAMIGCLIYISIWTRPDIAFTVNFLAHYMTRPNDKLIKAARCIFKYPKGTNEQGIWFRKDYPKRLGKNVMAYTQTLATQTATSLASLQEAMLST